jgi:hypothetical protein
VICPALFECGCDDPYPLPPYADVEECRAFMIAEFQETQAWANDNNLTYDGVCAAVRLGYLEENVCDSTDIIGPPTCEERCDIYYGDLEYLDNCMAKDADPWHILEISDCEEGLFCFGGLCDEKTVNAQTGCLTPKLAGEDCSGTFTACEHGYYCDADEICSPTLSEGQSCEDAFDGCAQFTFCNEDWTCEASKGEGEPCTGGWECISSLCDYPGAEVCHRVQPLVCEFYG